MDNYKNPELGVNERVADLLERMSIEEKLGQMLMLAAIDENAESYIPRYKLGSYLHALGDKISRLQAHNNANSRLGIPMLFAIDAIHGHCFEDGGTVFPSQLAMACTWDTQGLEAVARQTVQEARASGLHWTFSPVLCLARDPRWGRVGETFGEDPLLTGVLAAAFTEGYQGGENKIAACAKHFVAYGETDGGRDSADADVSERRLRTTFLPPFKKQVDHGCMTFMASYQALNGVPCSANTWLMNTVLREEWAYEGVVVTDWNNLGQMLTLQHCVEDMKQAVLLGLSASNDIFMSTPEFFDCALELIQEGKVAESRIDESVKRILALKFKLGLFDAASDSQSRQQVLENQARWKLAQEVAEASLVLLKNEANTLPLSPKIGKIVLVGDSADDLLAHLGDWSFIPGLTAFQDSVTHRKSSTLFHDSLKLFCKTNNIDFEFVQGCSPTQSPSLAVDIPKDADVIIFCGGDTLAQHGEFHDRSSLELTGNQLQVMESLANHSATVVSVLLMSKPLLIEKVLDTSDAVLLSFCSGAKTGSAVTNTLFGKHNPCGKLPISFPRNEGQLPVYYYQAPGWHSRLSPHYHCEDAYIDVTGEPLLAFGEGQSFSDIEYGDVSSSQDALSEGGSVKLHCVLKNKSAIHGYEIVQLYIRQCVPGVTSPVKKLIDFQRVSMPADAAVEVVFEVVAEQLDVLDIHLKPTQPKGRVVFMLGSSSRDQDLNLIELKVK